MREELASLRPKLEIINDHENSRDTEVFQNETLRPILKFQNDLILAIFKNHLSKYKINLDIYNRAKSEILISNTIQNNSILRSKLIGLIIGLFTEKEWEIYINNEKEFNKRLINMLIKRIQDQLVEKISANYIH